MATSEKSRTHEQRIAVIGCGAIGTLHAQAVVQSEHAVLTAVCDIQRERAEAVAAHTSARVYDDVEVLLAAESLDAVTVATPGHLHVQPVIKALEAGCHVFCEKPMATNLEDAKRMVEAAALHGRYLAIDYNRRFGFGYRKAKELIAAGAIGDIRYAMIRVTEPITRPKNALKPHTILTSVLIHHIDLMRFFCGEVLSLHAFFNANDVALSFQFEDNAIGSLVGGWQEVAQWTRTSEWTEIGGTKGTLLIEDVMQGVKFWSANPDHIEYFRPNYFDGGVAFYDSLASHVHSFLERLAAGQPPLVTGHDGLRGLEIIQAAIESNQTGEVVKAVFS